MEVFTTLLESMFSFGDFFFDALTAPVTDLLTEYSSGFSSFVLELLEFANLTDFFSNVSLGVFFLGSGIITVLVVNIILWFIP